MPIIQNKIRRDPLYSLHGVWHCVTVVEPYSSGIPELTHDFMDNCTDNMDNSVAKLEFSRSVAVCIDPLNHQFNTALPCQESSERWFFKEICPTINIAMGVGTHVAVSRWCRTIKWSGLVMVLTMELMVGLAAAQAGITKAKLPDICRPYPITIQYIRIIQYKNPLYWNIDILIPFPK